MCQNINVAFSKYLFWKHWYFRYPKLSSLKQKFEMQFSYWSSSDLILFCVKLSITLEFFLKNFHWIHWFKWIVTKSKSEIVTRDTPCLTIVTFLDEAAQIKQESIPVGRVMPARPTTYIQPPDVSTGGWPVQWGPQVNKFDVTSRGWGPVQRRSVHWGPMGNDYMGTLPMDRIIDRQTWHYTAPWQMQLFYQREGRYIYLVWSAATDTYPKVVTKMYFLLLSLGRCLLPDRQYSWKPYHFWIFHNLLNSWNSGIQRKSFRKHFTDLYAKMKRKIYFHILQNICIS